MRFKVVTDNIIDLLHEETVEKNSTIFTNEVLKQQLAGYCFLSLLTQCYKCSEDL